MFFILTYVIPRLDIGNSVDYFIYYCNSNIYAIVGHRSFVAPVLKLTSDDEIYQYFFRCDVYDKYVLSDGSWEFLETVKPVGSSIIYTIRTFDFYYDYSTLRVNEKIFPDENNAFYFLFSSVDLKDKDNTIFIKANDVLRSSPYQESVIYPVVTRDSMTEPILNELSGIFLLCLSSIIFYLAIRKAIDFILSFLRGA